MVFIKKKKIHLHQLVNIMFISMLVGLFLNSLFMLKKKLKKIIYRKKSKMWQKSIFFILKNREIHKISSSKDEASVAYYV